MHALVDFLAQRRDLGFGEARHAERLDQVVDLARGHALERVDTPWIQASWTTAISAFSAVLRGSRKAG